MANLPKPVTRTEHYLNKIAQGEETNLPTPVTRTECYLNEIANNGGGGGGSSAAKDVTYDNTTSGLTATDVQAAIDEVAQGGGASSADDVSYDNTTSGLTATNVQDAIDEVAQSSGGDEYDIEISGTITENLTPEALEALTYKINSDIDTLLEKVQTNGNLKIKSTISLDMEVAVIVVGISSDNCDPIYTTSVEVANQYVQGYGGSGTSKNALVIGLYARDFGRWSAESHDIVMQGARILLYENATDAQAGNHNVAYIVNVQMGS